MSQERHRPTILPSQLRFTPYTTYYNSFFLLRMPVTFSGQLAEIGYSQFSELTLNSRYPNLGVTFHSVSSLLETVLKKYGVSHVSNVWCEQVPLFQVNFSSEYKLRKFLHAQQRVQSELASLFSSKLADQYPTTTPRVLRHEIPTTVQTQLFLISPNAAKKDARVVAVTLVNYSICTTLWKESEMFDFRALFQVYHLNPSKLLQQGNVGLKDLVTELCMVTNWFHMGVYMGVPHRELIAIRYDYQDTEDRKTHMLMKWMKLTSELTWSAVVRALVGIKMSCLAEKVAQKYGVMVPRIIDPQDTTLVEKFSSMDHQLASRIQQMIQGLGVHDSELTTIECSLDQSRKEKAFARSQHVRGKNNLTTVHNNTNRLLNERREVRQQLKLKEKELQYLQLLQKQQEENKDLGAIINGKEGEIKLLQESLDGLRQELQSSREEAKSLREQLHQSTIELAGKSAHVRRLERTRADAIAILENERRMVDHLLMQSAASGVGGAVKEVKFQLASAKRQYDSQFRYSDMESHREKIARKEDEIMRLSEEIQTLEAHFQEVPQANTCENELQVEEKLHKLTVELSGLTVELAEAEGEKLEAVRRLEALRREKKEMEQWIAELERKRMADLQKCTAVGSRVEVAKTAQVVQTPPKVCVALYDYKAQRSDEVDICADEELEVLEWDNQDGWCKGRKRDGQEGYFPQNYVSPIIGPNRSETPPKVCGKVGVFPSTVVETFKLGMADSGPERYSSWSGVELAETAQVTQCKVHLADAVGDPCTTTQTVTAKLKSIVSGAVIEAKVVSKTPPTYEVSYRPRERGRHNLIVTVKGLTIPVRVYVRQSPRLLGTPVRVIGRMNDPRTMVKTRNGEIIVCERKKVSVYRKDGQKIKTIESVQVQSGLESYRLDPRKVAVDDSGNMYITDCYSHRLFKLDSDGKLVKSVGGKLKGQERGQFDSPDGITINEDNNKVFVCDQHNHRIQIFNTDLNLITCFGTEGSGEGEFHTPTDLAIDGAGNLYVADQDNHRIQVFSQSGKFLRRFGKIGSGQGELRQPLGIHVDHDWVYVTEWSNHRVSVFTISGEFIASFGNLGTREGEFVIPFGITTDEDGYVYVCDYRNNRIQVF